EDVGLSDIRPPKGGTYGRYDYQRMPPVPLKLNGKLGWLASAPTPEHHIGEWMEEKIPGKNARAIVALKRATKKRGLPLPAAFVKFMKTPALHQKIRSSSDCFLDLGSAPVPSPKRGGYLIRFLCDSQGCVFWYLFLTADGSDHAVVASVDLYGTRAER